MTDLEKLKKDLDIVWDVLFYSSCITCKYQPTCQTKGIDCLKAFNNIQYNALANLKRED